ncbi:hypothetical protein D3C80_1630580 [compost metagenome]
MQHSARIGAGVADQLGMQGMRFIVEFFKLCEGSHPGHPDLLQQILTDQHAVEFCGVRLVAYWDGILLALQLEGGKGGLIHICTQIL